MDVVLVIARDAEHLDFGIIVVGDNSTFSLRLFRWRRGFLQRLDVVHHRLLGIRGAHLCHCRLTLSRLCVKEKKSGSDFRFEGGIDLKEKRQTKLDFFGEGTKKGCKRRRGDWTERGFSLRLHGGR